MKIFFIIGLVYISILISDYFKCKTSNINCTNCDKLIFTKATNFKLIDYICKNNEIVPIEDLLKK